MLIGLKNQLAKIHNSSLDTSHSARNLGFIIDEHLTFSDQFTSLSKACYYHIRQLRCIRPYLDSSTACTTATSIVHYKLDYCNSLYYKLPKSQLSGLQQIQNSLAHTVVKAPKSCHIAPILCSLHWLRINECIEYKLLTYKVLTTTQPPYLHNIISVQRPRSTRSSSIITLAQPPKSSSLKIMDDSFRYASSSGKGSHTLSTEILVPWSCITQLSYVHRHNLVAVYCCLVIVMRRQDSVTSLKCTETSSILIIQTNNRTCSPRESVGVCFYRRWFVCLSVTSITKRL